MITLYHLVDAVPAAFFGIVALWASGSRLHWFARAAVIGALLLLMLFIPAHEILIQFSVEVLVIAVGMAVWRHRRRGRDPAAALHKSIRRQFQVRLSLETLMLLMAVVAVVVAVMARTPNLAIYQWYGLSCNGAVMGAATLASVWLVHGKARAWMRIVAAPLIIFAFGAGWIWLGISRWVLRLWLTNAGPWRYLQSVFDQGLFSGVPDGVSIVGVGMLLVSIWLLLVSWAGWFDLLRSANDPSKIRERSRRERAAGWGATAVFALVGLVPLYLFYRLLTPTPTPDLAAPRPSAYDDLLAAGRLARNFDLFPVAATGPLMESQYRLAISENADAISMAQAAIANNCRLPLMDLTTQHFIPKEENQALAKVIQLFVHRWTLASRLGATDECIAASVDVLKLSFCGARSGGTDEFSALMGDFDYEVLDMLWQLRSKFSAAQCVALVNELLRFDSERPGWEERAERQRIIDENAGWYRHLRSMLEDWSPAPTTSQRLNLFRARQLQMRMLTTDLAIRVFLASYGHLPKTLAELVPEFLPAVPQDPFANGLPIRYRVDGSAYQLYSVGYNGTDDGGQPQTRIPGQPILDLTEVFLFSPPLPAAATATNQADLKNESTVSEENDDGPMKNN